MSAGALADRQAALAGRAATVALAVLLPVAVAAGTERAPALAGAGIVVAVFAAMTAWAPDLATPAVVGLIFANVPGVAVQTHGAPAMVAAVVPMLLVLPLVVRMRAGEGVIVPRPFVLLLALFVAELGSALLSEHQDVAISKMQTFVVEAVILYFLTANAIRRPQVLKWVLWTIVGAGAVLALVTVFQDLTRTYWRFYGGFALPDPSFAIGKTTEPRASGPVGDPNYYGQVLMVATCVSLVFAWRSRTALQRTAALVATGLMVYAILLTYSRGTMLGLFVVLVIMAFLRYFKPWQLLVTALAIGVVFLAVPAFSARLLSISSVASATEATGTDASADQSAQGRATEMLAAAHVFFDHPVLGVGPANFPLYYRRYAEEIGGEIHDSVLGGANKGEEAQRQAHNMVISQFAELGVVGAGTFLVLVGTVIAQLLRARRRWLALGERDLADMVTALLLAVLAYLICGLFLTLAFERYFWMLLGISGGVCAMALRSRTPAASLR